MFTLIPCQEPLWHKKSICSRITARRDHSSQKTTANSYTFYQPSISQAFLAKQTQKLLKEKYSYYHKKSKWKTVLTHIISSLHPSIQPFLSLPILTSSFHISIPAHICVFCLRETCLYFSLSFRDHFFMHLQCKHSSVTQHSARGSGRGEH